MEDLDSVIDKASNINAKAQPVGKKEGKRPVHKAAFNRLEKEVNKAIALRPDPMPVTVIKKTFDNFEAAVGGREELIATLQHCPEDSPSAKILKKLFADKDILIPTRAGLYDICMRSQIPLNMVIAAFRDAKMAQVAVQSIAQLAVDAPKIVEQLSTDSQNRFDDCTVCEGSTRVPRMGDNGEWMVDFDGNQVTQLCYNCRGTGKVYVKHDFANRKAFLQITGILEERKTPLAQVNINQQTANIYKENFLPGDGTFEKLIKAIDATNVKVKEEEPIDVPFVVYDEEPIISEESTP